MPAGGKRRRKSKSPAGGKRRRSRSGSKRRHRK